MPEIPSCYDSQRDLLRKILLQFISMATGAPESVQPQCDDSEWELYRKILLTLAFV